MTELNQWQHKRERKGLINVGLVLYMKLQNIDLFNYVCTQQQL